MARSVNRRASAPASAGKEAAMRAEMRLNSAEMAGSPGLRR